MSIIENECDKVDSLLTTTLNEFRGLKAKWNEEKANLMRKIEVLEKRNRKLEGERKNENKVQADPRKCDPRKFYTMPSASHRKKRSQESLADIIMQFQEPVAQGNLPSRNDKHYPQMSTRVRSHEISNNPSRSLKKKRTLRHHMDSIRDIAFHSTKPVLVSAGFDRVVKLWFLDSVNAKRKTLHPISLRNTTKANACEVCANVIISGDVKGDLRFWNLPRTTGRVNQYGQYLKPSVVSNHTDCVTSIASAPSSRFFASTAADGLVNIWNIDDRPRKALSTARVPSDIPSCCSWGPDSEMLYVGGLNGGLFMYDFTEEVKLKYSIPLGSLIYDLAVHQDKRYVVTAHKDRKVRFSDPREPRGNTLESFCAASDAVTSVALTADSYELVTTGHDASIRLWDVRYVGRARGKTNCLQDIEREDTHQLKGPGLEGALKVRIHSQLPLLATAGADGVVQLFDVV